LLARKAQTMDLLVNLFKGYKACKDAKFLAYITQMEDSHEDGTAEITANTLMTRASNYYKKRMIAANASGSWEGQDPVDEKFQMMEAQIEKLKSLKKKVTFTGNDKKPKASREPKPSWLVNNVAPSDPKQTKTWNNKTWYWCHKDSGGKCSGKWRLHKPDDCQGKEYLAAGDKRPKKAKGKSSKSKKERMDAARKIIAAQELLMQSIQEEEESDSDSEDENDE
jgi:hypothetical protein